MISVPKKGRLVSIIHDKEAFTWYYKEDKKPLEKGCIHFLKCVQVPDHESFEFTAWFSNATFHVLDIKRTLSCGIYHSWEDRLKSFKTEWMDAYTSVDTDPCKMAIPQPTNEPQSSKNRYFFICKNSPHPSVKEYK